jgi:hypothetical protein
MAEPKEGSKNYKRITGHGMHHAYSYQQERGTQTKELISGYMLCSMLTIASTQLQQLQHSSKLSPPQCQQVLQRKFKVAAFKRVESSTIVL